MNWSENEWLDFEMSIKMGLDLPKEVLMEAIMQYQMLELNQNSKEEIENLKETHYDEKTALQNEIDDVEEKYNELVEQVENLQNGTLIEQYNNMKKDYKKVLVEKLKLENELKDKERNSKNYETMWIMINRKHNELQQKYFALKRQIVK